MRVRRPSGRRVSPSAVATTTPVAKEQPKYEVRIEHPPGGGREVVISTRSTDGSTHEIRHDLPDAVVHHYRPPSEVHADMPLYAGTFRYAGDAREWTGDVRYTWKPTPTVEARGWRYPETEELQDFFNRLANYDTSDVWSSPAALEIELPEALLPKQPERLAVPLAHHEGASQSSARLEQQVGDSSTLDRVTFLIPNGWEAYDERGICDASDRAATWYGRTEARGDGWLLTFDRRRDVEHTLWSDLKRTGGYGFTHTGSMEREDGSTFTGDEAFEAMSRVRIGLNIALGRRVTCALPVGWLQGRPVWTRWRSAPVDPFSNKSHWLDREITSSQISEIVSAVLNATVDAAKKDAVAYATAYYVTAQVNVDVQLAAAIPVPGLQLLSYLHLVSEQKLYSSTTFKDLIAEKQLRPLLDRLKIATSIPPRLRNLAAVGQRSSASGPALDALGAVIRMRNVAMHPTHGRPAGYSIYEWAEAGMMARYWFCLALLHAVGYAGDISESLSPYRQGQGGRVRVPWAKGP